MINIFNFNKKEDEPTIMFKRLEALFKKASYCDPLSGVSSYISKYTRIDIDTNFGKRFIIISKYFDELGFIKYYELIYKSQTGIIFTIATYKNNTRITPDISYPNAKLDTNKIDLAILEVENFIHKKLIKYLEQMEILNNGRTE